MKTFGQVLRDVRKTARLTQGELAARLKREDGRPAEPPYLNALEHPPVSAQGLYYRADGQDVGISPDVLYFHANRQPPGVKTEADQELVKAAYHAFRKALGVKAQIGKRK